MTSMAAALAASLPAAVSTQATPQPAAQQPSKVPQRLEGVVDVEAAREVENVSLSSLVSRKVALVSLLSCQRWHEQQDKTGARVLIRGGK